MISGCSITCSRSCSSESRGLLRVGCCADNVWNSLRFCFIAATGTGAGDELGGNCTGDEEKVISGTSSIWSCVENGSWSMSVIVCCSVYLEAVKPAAKWFSTNCTFDALRRARVFLVLHQFMEYYVIFQDYSHQ